MTERDRTAALYVVTLPAGRRDGASTQEQEAACRAYAEEQGFVCHSTLVCPVNHEVLPDLMDAEIEWDEIGHLVFSDTGVIPDVGELCQVAGAKKIHLHEACSGRMTFAEYT